MWLGASSWIFSDYVASHIPLDIKAWKNTINVFILLLYLTEQELDGLFHHDSWNILGERRMLNGGSVYNVNI